MANNYLQFSFAIPLKSDDERAWAKSAVDYLDEWVNDDCPEIIEADANELFYLLPDDEGLGYTVEVDEDGIWVYAEESGTPDNVVPLAQGYLRRFDPDGSISFEWSDTCSKPRLDEFGGGAVFITATDVRYMHTSTWIAEQLSKQGTA